MTRSPTETPGGLREAAPDAVGAGSGESSPPVTQGAPGGRKIVRRDVEGRSAPSIPSLHPLLQRIFSARGIRVAAELEHSLENLPSPSLFKDMDVAVERLLRALDRNEDILVLGDYDADGATASVLAMLGLRSLGASRVDYLVPNRFEYGYGLSPEIARVAVDMSPSLVITVDNGISSVEGVQLLRDDGIDVIVTDHHLPGEHLPPATAIINPNQDGCPFPSGKIAGVGVVFYLLLALRARMRERGDFSMEGASPPNLARFLDLVALGTVADVVPLDHVNRTLVAQGIARIQKGYCRPGILALLEVAGRNPADTTSSDLGFVVAPRLNAAGRLDDIGLGIECLLTDDGALAAGHAERLHQINLERRQIEQRMQREALSIVAGMSLERDSLHGICLFARDWHPGITGLVASRVKERYFEPVIAFAPSSEGRLSGSARSVPGLNIRDLLADLAAANPGLVERFGGHAMAAGLTIRNQEFEAFRSAFRSAVNRHFEVAPPSTEMLTDGPLEEEFFTREIADMLRNAAPWGQQFPAPVFDNEFKVVSHRVVGGQHLKLRLRTRDRLVDAIAFRVLEPGEEPSLPDRIRAVFQLDVNHYRGESTLQLIIEHMEAVPSGRSVPAGAVREQD